MIHSSSRLKEVAGGSYLLGKYCFEYSERIAHHVTNGREYSFVRNRGGEVICSFHEKYDALQFMEYMKECYRRIFGRPIITSTKPIEYEIGGDESIALKEIKKDISDSLYTGFPPSSHVQNPYVAICWSCGERPSEVVYTEEGSSDEHHICESCDLKYFKFDGYREEVKGKLNGAFKQIPSGVDYLAKDNKSGYCAYMLSDGNSFGDFVHQIEDMRNFEAFNNALPDTVDKSLFSILDEVDSLANDGTAPMLPLMTGGDDLLILFPARWGISMACDFVSRFQENATQLAEYSKNRQPLTMSAGVVICKQTLSHKIAYNLGKKVIKRAKLKSKENEISSSVAFQILVGTKRGGETQSHGVYASGDICGGFLLKELETIFEKRRELEKLPSRIRRKLKHHLISGSPRAEDERNRILELTREMDESLYNEVKGLLNPKNHNILFAILEGWDYLERHRREL